MNTDNKIGILGGGISAIAFAYFYDERVSIIEKEESLQDFLSGSRNRMSSIGTRFKSANCGLIFGEGNPLGTDSIAFGGLKK